MKVPKIIKELEDERDYKLKLYDPERHSFMFFRKICALNEAIGLLQDVLEDMRENGECLNVHYYHPTIDDIKSMQSAESRAFRKMESNTI